MTTRETCEAGIHCTVYVSEPTYIQIKILAHIIIYWPITVQPK